MPDATTPSKLSGMTDKLQAVRDAGTSAVNYDLQAEDILARLEKWDRSLGLEVIEAGHDRVVLQFDKLPPDVPAFAAELYEFCPDLIDQGFGAIVELIEMSKEHGHAVPDNVKELVEGVDLAGDEDQIGLTLLVRDLEKTRRVGLWWD